MKLPSEFVFLHIDLKPPHKDTFYLEMDKFDEELTNFVRFCEKLAKYNISTLSDGLKGSPVINEISLFGAAFTSLHSKRPSYFVSIFKNLFDFLYSDFAATEELASLEFLKKPTIEVIAGQSGKSKIRIGILYSKACTISEKVTEYLEKSSSEEERQELNYPAAFLYHLFKTFDSLIVNRGDYQKNFDQSLLITNKEHIQLIEDNIHALEVFLGMKKDDQSGVAFDDVGDRMKSIVEGIPKDLVKQAAKSSSELPKITSEEIKKAVGALTDSKILDRLTSGLQESLQQGDVMGMLSGILGMAKDPEIYNTVTSSFGGPELTKEDLEGIKLPFGNSSE